jgi:hypothetical protein
LRESLRSTRFGLSIRNGLTDPVDAGNVLLNFNSDSDCVIEQWSQANNLFKMWSTAGGVDTLVYSILATGPSGDVRIATPDGVSQQWFTSGAKRFEIDGITGVTKGLVNDNGTANAATQFTALTQVEYDAIVTKDADTFYLIIG